MRALAQQWNVGEFTLKILKREGDLAIAEKSWREDLKPWSECKKAHAKGVHTSRLRWPGTVTGYEVAHVQKNSSREFPGGVTVEASEGWPGDAVWGVKAWSCKTLDRAEVILEREGIILAYMEAKPTTEVKRLVKGTKDQYTTHIVKTTRTYVPQDLLKM